MNRIDASGTVTARPAPAATQNPGFFTNGNPGSQAATVVNDDWLNGVQESIMSVQDAAGLAASVGDGTQLLLAIKMLARAQMIRLTGTAEVNPQQSGVVVVDASAGNMIVVLPAPAGIVGTVEGVVTTTPYGFDIIRTDQTTHTVSIQVLGETASVGGVLSLPLLVGQSISVVSDIVSPTGSWLVRSVAGNFQPAGNYQPAGSYQPAGNYQPAGSYQPALGYTPVQQGTGPGQGSNAIKIGWGGTGNPKLKAAVDASDLGNTALEAWAQANLGIGGEQMRIGAALAPASGGSTTAPNVTFATPFPTTCDGVLLTANGRATSGGADVGIGAAINITPSGFTALFDSNTASGNSNSILFTNAFQFSYLAFGH